MPPRRYNTDVKLLPRLLVVILVVIVACSEPTANSTLEPATAEKLPPTVPAAATTTPQPVRTTVDSSTPRTRPRSVATPRPAPKRPAPPTVPPATPAVDAYPEVWSSNGYDGPTFEYKTNCFAGYETLESCVLWDVTGVSVVSPSGNVFDLEKDFNINAYSGEVTRRWVLYGPPNEGLPVAGAYRFHYFKGDELVFKQTVEYQPEVIDFPREVVWRKDGADLVVEWTPPEGVDPGVWYKVLVFPEDGELISQVFEWDSTEARLEDVPLNAGDRAQVNVAVYFSGGYAYSEHVPMLWGLEDLAEPPAATDPSSSPIAGAEDDTDVCGNAVGNGNEVISGPSAPQANDRDSVFRSLTVHPTDSDIVLMGTERNGFVRSVDGGVTWTRHRLGLRWQRGTGYPEIYDIAISPRDPTIVFAATVDSPGPVIGDYPSSIAGLYKSTDGGETWVRKNCGLTSSRVVAVRFDFASPDRAIVTIGAGERSFDGNSDLPTFFDGGIFTTENGGDDWKRSPAADNDTLNDFHTLVVADGDLTVLITFGLHTFQGGAFDPALNIGFLRSIDGGGSWERFGAPEVASSKITHFDASADGAVVYATVTDSYHHWISTDSGSTWAKSSINQGSGPVAVSPADPDVVIFRDSAQTSLFRSVDGLQTYSKVVTTEGLSNDPNVRYAFEDVVFAPSDPTVVYAATTGLLVYKSTDGGASFVLMKNIRSEVLNALP